MSSFMGISPEVLWVIYFSLFTPVLALLISVILYFAYLKDFTSFKRTLGAFFLSAIIIIPAAMLITSIVAVSFLPGFFAVVF